MVTMTLKIADEVFEVVRDAAARTGRSIDDVMTDAAAQLCAPKGSALSEAQETELAQADAAISAGQFSRAEDVLRDLKAARTK